MPFASPHPHHPPLFAIFAICFILILCNFRTATTPQRAIQNQIGAAGAEWQLPQHPPRLLRLPQRQRPVPKKPLLHLPPSPLCPAQPFLCPAHSPLCPAHPLHSLHRLPPLPAAIRFPAESRLSPEQPAFNPPVLNQGPTNSCSFSLSV